MESPWPQGWRIWLVFVLRRVRLAADRQAKNACRLIEAYFVVTWMVNGTVTGGLLSLSTTFAVTLWM